MASSRDRILDAYERLIIDSGERTTTLEGVASDAGVSKGGLLYHFGSKDALRSGLLERLRDRAGEELPIPDDAEAAVRLFLDSSADLTGPFHATFLASQTLARNGHRDAADAIRDVEEGWYDGLAAATGDPVVARLTQLVGDGIYDNAGIAPTPSAGFSLAPSDDERAAVADLIVTLLRRGDAGRSVSA